jgi:hypothetical protein
MGPGGIPVNLIEDTNMLGYGVKETTTTTGTGTLTLSSVSGFPRFADAFATGDLVQYSILNSAGEPLECGIGTVAASNTLERTFPMVTYSGGTYDNTSPSALSLSAGTYTVICTGSPASSFPFLQSVWTGSGKAVHSMHTNGGIGSNVPMAANRLYVMPFLWGASLPMVGLGCRISTGAGTSATIGLYTCKNGLPGTLLQSGTVNTATSATMRSISFTQVWYPPGWYYTAMVCDAAPNIQATSTLPANMSPLSNDGTGGGILTALYTANGSITLPTSYSASGATIVANAQFPSIWAIVP